MRDKPALRHRDLRSGDRHLGSRRPPRLARTDFGLIALPDGGPLVVGGTRRGRDQHGDRRALRPVASLVRGGGDDGRGCQPDRGAPRRRPRPCRRWSGRSRLHDGQRGHRRRRDLRPGPPTPGPRQRPSRNPASGQQPSPSRTGRSCSSAATAATSGEPSTPWCPEPIAEAVRYVPANLAAFPKPTPRPRRGRCREARTSPRASAPPSAAKKAAAAINAFGLDLYQRILADGTLDPSQGAVISPTSIALALAMARAGAKGDTAAQMDTVMRSAGADTLATAMNALDRALASRSGRFDVYGGESGGDVLLKIANTPFAQEGMSLEQPYLDTLASRYGADVRRVDYQDRSRRRSEDDQRLGEEADGRPDPEPAGRAGRDDPHPPRPRQRDVPEGALAEPVRGRRHEAGPVHPGGRLARHRPDDEPGSLPG